MKFNKRMYSLLILYIMKPQNFIIQYCILLIKLVRKFNHLVY